MNAFFNQASASQMHELRDRRGQVRGDLALLFQSLFKLWNF